MTTICFVKEQVETFRAASTGLSLESCATGLVAIASMRDKKSRYVVRDFAAVPEDAYMKRDSVRAVLSPEFVLSLANKARRHGAGLFIAHTHVGDACLDNFSSVDDEGESALNTYFSQRIPGHTHFAGLITETRLRCRQLGGENVDDARLIGESVVRAPSSSNYAGDDKYDRQIRAFGLHGQQELKKIRVAIIGLGGTGSFVAQELAHLGVCNYLLVDPDQVEKTNLNRLLGAQSSDISVNKTHLAKRNILNINEFASVEEIVGDVVNESIAKLILGVDFIFLCTDSHASRAVVNQIAYQYLIPCIDMGVAIHVREGRVAHVVGRIQMLSGGLPCLVCGNWIDANQVRHEMMTPEQRTQDPYFVGGGVAQPAVVSLNGTVASAAVTMFLSAVTGFPGDSRLMLYDAVRGSMRPSFARRETNCVVCSPSGALARGNSWSLPTRREILDA